MIIGIVDYETENVEYCGLTASPHCPDNYVILAGYIKGTVDELTTHLHNNTLHTQVVTKEYTSVRHKSVSDVFPKGGRPKEQWDGLQDLMDCDLIVAHNALYEMSWWLKHDKHNFNEYIKQGKKIYCTAYAHYLLSGMVDKYPALSDIAPKYGGTSKLHVVHALFKSGARTSEIDRDLLKEYLSGENGDVVNTAKVFLGTYAKMLESNMMDNFTARMYSMVFSAYCMNNGMFINKDIAKTLRNELDLSLQKLTDKLQKDLRVYAPALSQRDIDNFNWNSRICVSSLLFGGSYNYVVKLPKTIGSEIIYTQQDAPLFKINNELIAINQDDCVLQDYLYTYYNPKDDTTYTQVLYERGINAGKPKWGKVKTSVPKIVNTTIRVELPGIVYCKHKNIIYKNILEAWEKTIMPIGSQVLQFLIKLNYKLAEDTLERVTLLKNISTFFGNNDDGMLKFLTEKGVIHHSLVHTSTHTGRLSSVKPNLQQLPKGNKSRVKEMFTSRFGDDGYILQCDYKMLEAVGLQVITSDNNLAHVINSGIDVHTLRLSYIEKIPYEELLAIIKDKTHPDHSKYVQKRSDVKPIAFQYQYGASAKGMSLSSGKPVKFCKNFIEAEKKAFPVVEEWFENFYEFIKNDSLKRDRLPAMYNGSVISVGQAKYIAKDKTIYTFKQIPYRNNITGDITTKFSIPQMRNYPVQGGSSFFVQLAISKLIRWLINNDFFGYNVLPINTVHDSVIFDIHKDYIKKVLIPIELILESISDLLRDNFNINPDVEFQVDSKIGTSLADDNTSAKECLDMTEEDYKILKSKTDRRLLWT